MCHNDRRDNKYAFIKVYCATIIYKCSVLHSHTCIYKRGYTNRDIQRVWASYMTICLQ